MLKFFIVQRLSRYIKGFSHDQVSARLLAGELKLKDVEVELDEVADLLVGLLPYTLQLRHVRCRSVSAKVPWKALRRLPICVEVQGCDVEVQVHHADEREWLAAQTAAQRRHLVQGAVRNADEAFHEDEDERQPKLRVGLRELVLDGLRVSLKDLSVVLTSERPVEPPPLYPPALQEGGSSAGAPCTPIVTLSLDAVSAVPCTHSGVPVERPDDVYEVSDPFVRVCRLLEVAGLKLESPLLTRTDVPLAGTDHQREASVVLEHVDGDAGPIQVRVEQQRLSGFIPHHHTRRVCPFSSEVFVSAQLGRVEFRASEGCLRAIVAAALDAVSPTYVPRSALPLDLLHLHWEAASTLHTPGGVPGPSLSPSHASRPLASDDLGGASASDNTGNRRALHRSVPPVTSRVHSWDPLDCFRWSAPAAAGGAVAGLESREQHVRRRLVQLVVVQLRLCALCGRVARDVDTAAALLSLHDFAFSRDTVHPLKAFERRCVAELGLISLAPVQKAGTSAGYESASECRDAAAATHMQRSLRRRLACNTPRGAEGAADGVASTGEQRKHAIRGEGTGGPSLSGATAEPRQEPALLCLNAVTLGSAGLSWQAASCPRSRSAPAEGKQACSRRLLELGSPVAPGITFHWKEATSLENLGSIEDQSWQPVEACIHGLRVALDFEGWSAIVGLTQHCLQAAMEGVVAPSFEAQWCRITLHGFEMDVVTGAGTDDVAPHVSAGILVPAVLLTSLLGIGELFCALDVLPPLPFGPVPSAVAMSVTENPVVGASAPRPMTSSAPLSAEKSATDVFGLNAARAARRAVGCACGRELAGGAVRLTSGFLPVRTQLSDRPWVAQRSAKDRAGGLSPGGLVIMQREEFSALMRAHIGVEAWTASLPSLQKYYGSGDESARASTDCAPMPSQLSDCVRQLKRDRSRRAGARNSHSVGGTGAIHDDAAREEEVEAIARRWASTQETVRRLRCELEEVRMRCLALRATLGEEAQRAEALAAERVCLLAAQIARDRSKQADLSAEAEEQQILLARLQRSMPSCWSLGV